MAKRLKAIVARKTEASCAEYQDFLDPLRYSAMCVTIRKPDNSLRGRLVRAVNMVGRVVFSRIARDASSAYEWFATR